MLKKLDDLGFSSAVPGESGFTPPPSPQDTDEEEARRRRLVQDTKPAKPPTTVDIEMDDLEAREIARHGHRSWGDGGPVMVGREAKSRRCVDGAGLCSPGCWPRAKRKYRGGVTDWLGCRMFEELGALAAEQAPGFISSLSDALRAARWIRRLPLSSARRPSRLISARGWTGISLSSSIGAGSTVAPVCGKSWRSAGSLPQGSGARFRIR